MDRGTCRSCEAPVLWVVMDGTGKKNPLDLKPQKRVILVSDGRSEVAKVDTYVSHFATCPNAAQHRKPKEERDG